MFAENPFTEKAKFNIQKFYKITYEAQRLMDDMIDLEIEQVEKILQKIDHDPEPPEVKQIEKDLWLNIENQARSGRRTGLGVTGVGDAIAMLGQVYGSEESIELVLYRF